MDKGKRSGPYICTFISDSMLNLIRCKIFGGKLISHIGKYLYRIVIHDFFYYTYLLQNERSGYDIIEDVATEMDKMLYLGGWYFKAVGG